ncbi:MAG: CehA/McbA family metallohydrolase [Solobacterium sp.]|jgi:hypothetical protein|nr:CehA/McbA family metallohydrolase [Solobacterium sp.]
MRHLIQTDKNWYQGNLHMHTDRSDGHASTAEAIETYRKHGYDFIALTDHRRPSIGIEPNSSGVLDGEEILMKDMLLLSGVEWDTRGRNTSLPGDVPCFHILGIGMNSSEHSRDFDRILHPEPHEIIDTVKKDGGFAILAHPSWSVMDPAAIMACKGIGAAEIYNAVSDIPWNGQRSDSSAWFDIWASHYNALIPAVAGDDVHQYSGDECRSFTMVNAESLSRDAIMKSLAEGNFYASQGPKIKELTFDEETRTIHVACTKDVVMACFYSNHIWTKERFQHVQNGTAVYHLTEGESYIRAELITADGRKAWTSPYSVL